MNAPKKQGHMEIRTPRLDDPDWRRAAALAVSIFRLDVVRLVSNREVREATDALEERTGLRRVELVVWAAVAAQKPAGRAYWEKLNASGTGKSWKALTGFPERIREMAKELDTLCRSDSFGVEEAGRFSSLPSQLNDYANWMKSRLEEIAALRNPPRRRGLSQWKMHLSRRVKALTGHFHDTEIARLINAVNEALNGEGNSEKGIDGQSLADLRSRGKRKVSKT